MWVEGEKYLFDKKPEIFENKWAVLNFDPKAKERGKIKIEKIF